MFSKAYRLILSFFYPSDEKEPKATTMPFVEFMRELSHTPKDSTTTTQPTTAAVRSNRITTVGAWCGTTSLRNPERDVAFARAHGINRLDIIVNDHSRSRSKRKFSVRSQTKIVRLAKIARDAGIEVHLMSWVMPHKEYIEQAAAVLLPLLAATEATSIQWDVEEPWTRAKGAMDYTEAAKLIEKQFASRSCRMGANGIGYTPQDKFAPIANICDYIVPQAYSTTRNGADPSTLVHKQVTRWKKNFGNVDMAIGLAAYRQSPKNALGDLSAKTRIRLAVQAAEREGADTVIYWSLRWIRKNKEVAAEISKVLAGTQHGN